jgi:hypothetical protein
MAHDEAEEERTFLADLQARSGRDLAAWMHAISEQGFSDKNETIDWLRAQGFPFARASWLERIHSNGGRPIYLDAPPEPGAVIVPDARPAPAIAPKPKPTPSPKPAPQAAADAPSLETLIASAKGYRPLYQILEGMIRQVVPDVVLTPNAGYITFWAGGEFAIIQPTGSEIRLGLALGDRPHDANLGPVRIKGAGPAITHMISLKDARQVNAELQGLIAAAFAHVAA